ncbi:MAG: RnfABCDGE type electron transport complex subunit A [Chlorobium sp.]|jgi:electron transport complex protein RnfA|uniref:electron transport complex protein RnfA n=1 Tax=Chlorobium sp. TaxID=1095 RepID=UPI001E107CCA|nr:RnfABCDGE type electron transport complex subunit A [Chlorobium sp.]MBN1278618.1 RnfABCDGE type electron transport complex subunit A [Chlorobiaceae bacterium]MCF8216032.1 RnfABCDGE type electron transport complex subunit A [Chlorobium sp.]MCF8270933.1 RnfABCDGE type electron transport complex subunit A [Chlorobium sp.]MCF8287307.1 RnfABCDGE type electron transport complex subunit A [Chlorobium sp.]MCF8291393.1 RnfABCDGE type electron transport complex subunit A [Chlorobium sp.]
MPELLLVIVSAVFVNNVVFARFLGICPYLGVSKNLDTAIGMGFAVTFVMTVSTALTYILQKTVLIPFGIEFMQTVMFILVIASLVQLVEIVLKKVSKSLYSSLGIYLPLITTNCAILGMALIAIQEDYDLLTSVVFAFFSAMGFILAIVMFAGIRMKLEEADVPAPFKNVPVGFISAAILSLAFMGFSGLVK